MISRVTILAAAALFLTAPAIAAELMPLNWQIGDRATLVTELKGADLQRIEQALAELDKREQRFGGDALHVRYSLDLGKWYAKANYDRIGDVIRAGSDFQRKVGKDHTELVLGRSWRGHSGDWWSTKILRTAWEVSHTNDGQTLVDRYVTEFGVDGAMDSKLRLRYQSGDEYQAGRLIGISHLVLAGQLQPHDSIQLGVETHVGERLDRANTRLAEQERVAPYLDWKLGKQLSLKLDGAFVAMDTKDGQPILDGRIVDARVTWQLGDMGKLLVNVQQQDIHRNPDAYLDNVAARTSDIGRKFTYSWQMNEQTEVQLGFADAYLENNAIEIIGSTGRSWFMNVGYQLSL